MTKPAVYHCAECGKAVTLGQGIEDIGLMFCSQACRDSSPWSTPVMRKAAMQSEQVSLDRVLRYVEGDIRPFIVFKADLESFAAKLFKDDGSEIPITAVTLNETYAVYGALLPGYPVQVWAVDFPDDLARGVYTLKTTIRITPKKTYSDIMMNQTPRTVEQEHSFTIEVLPDPKLDSI